MNVKKLIVWSLVVIFILIVFLLILGGGEDKNSNIDETPEDNLDINQDNMDLEDKDLVNNVTPEEVVEEVIINSGGGSSGGSSGGGSVDEVAPEEEVVEEVIETIKQKGDRLLGIATNEDSSNDYFSAFAISQGAGLEFMQLSLAWDDIETSEGVYQDPWALLQATDAYYHTQGVKVLLMVGPLDTTNKRMPSYLSTKDYNDPEVMVAYNNMIDFVMPRLSNTDLVALAIGNEIDIYLHGSDAWTQYTEFFQNTSSHVKANYPGLKVGTKATYESIVGDEKDEIILINQNSDVVMVTYYPFSEGFIFNDPVSVGDDMDLLTSLYSKPIYLSEAGYSSSALLGSSESRQSQFVVEMFKAWDKHSDEIKLIDFVWLHDISQSKLDEYESYYGFSDPNFLAYLATLGLRNNDGTDKLAFVTLKNESEIRGW